MDRLPTSCVLSAILRLPKIAVIQVSSTTHPVLARLRRFEAYRLIQECLLSFISIDNTDLTNCLYSLADLPPQPNASQGNEGSSGSTGGGGLSGGQIAGIVVGSVIGGLLVSWHPARTRVYVELKGGLLRYSSSWEYCSGSWRSAGSFRFAVTVDANNNDTRNPGRSNTARHPPKPIRLPNSTTPPCWVIIPVKSLLRRTAV
jgi:hypothetical protein